MADLCFCAYFPRFRSEYLFACPANCTWPLGGQCSNHQCVCKPGRSGDDCADVTDVSCTLSCASSGHGECVDGKCSCFSGFYGPSCAQGCVGWTTAGKPCSGRGECVTSGSPNVSPDVCRCRAGFAGDGCELDLDGVTTCPRGCSSHGTCSKGRCQCADGFAGSDCSIELRHGRLSHLLDNPLNRLAAVVTIFTSVSLIAYAFKLWIDAAGNKYKVHEQQQAVPMKQLQS